jgi:hypothetical protein
LFNLLCHHFICPSIVYNFLIGNNLIKKNCI